jgi:hypothetical protein
MNSVWDTWVASGNTPPRTTAPVMLAKADWKIETVAAAAASRGDHRPQRYRLQSTICHALRKNERVCKAG